MNTGGMNNGRMDKQHAQRLADIKSKRAFRVAEVGTIDVEKRTVELAFSSEEPVLRYFGWEVLSHAPGAAVMDRLHNGAPLLLNHEVEDQIGVTEFVSIDADRRGRAVVRFGRSELAEEIFQDVRDRIRQHVSVGYTIHDAELSEVRDDQDVWTITRWEPFEISIVAVPADPSVGVGRSLDPATPPEPRQPAPPSVSGVRSMENNEDHNPAAAPAASPPPAPPTDIADLQRKASEAEQARTRAISELGEKYHAPELAMAALKDGKSPEEFRAMLLDHMNTRAQKPLGEQMKAGDIGLTDQEARAFSFVKVIRALSDPTDRRAQKDAAFEFEASRAAAERSSKPADRFMVPSDVLTRALNTATNASAAGNTGGYSIARELLAQSFIEILRNKATIMRLGTTMGGLVGNIDIPKQIAAATGYWLGEDADATETNLELGQISMTPKTVAAYSEITRRLLMQSSLDIEALVRADLATALALTIDKAGYYGSGVTVEPRGITQYTGINAVDFTGTQPEFAELVAMETEIALDNADVASMAYVSNASFRGWAKSTPKFKTAGSDTIWEGGNTVNGYRTEITNQITAGDVIFGNFADLLIGLWGGLELLVDPYTHSKKGRLRVVVFQDVDYALRRVESFCLGKKATGP